MFPPTDARSLSALRLCLRGQVQGRGVRPAIARLAQNLELAGSVQNTLAGLLVMVEGEPLNVSRFREALPLCLPAGCRLDGIDQASVGVTGCTQFVILRDAGTGPLATQIPPDIAACDDCLREVDEPANRRHGYPLTTCAACGPRYTVITRMPYERPQTTLAAFSLCAACRGEYSSPADRRYHAQTLSCRTCGPHVWAVGAQGRLSGSDTSAWLAATSALRDGLIVAVRGVGGYQLLCDATNETAVRRLRARKRRPAKPLALLVHASAKAAGLAFLSATELATLEDPSNPIVLVRARAGTALAASIHPGLDTLGIMLPTTPLHALLAAEFGRPLVCTSGNLEGDPLQYEPVASERRLSGIADLWLHHDRPIARPIDDSVVRVIAERAVTLRLARGLAPLHLDCQTARPTVAFGGHMKLALAWNNGSQSVLGPHIGDMDTLAARERFSDQWQDWQELYRFAPAANVRDLHPDYFSARLALGQAQPSLPVQHHFAHVAAGMLEHRLLDQQVLGVAWDGTGYGNDGTIWGGEFLVVDRARRFQRVACLRPFALPGGELAVREPDRIAVALLSDALGRDRLLRSGIPGVDPRRIVQIVQVLDVPRANVRTTSAGRLFDAAAALILGIARVDFEGQAAMLLESIADRDSTGSYPLPLRQGTPEQLDWQPLFAGMHADRRAGVAPGVMAMRFHRSLSEGIAAVAAQHRDLPVVLCGGVFQNRVLTELVVELLNDTSRLKLPGRIPPNDGGLAAGQLAVAAQLDQED